MCFRSEMFDVLAISGINMMMAGLLKRSFSRSLLSRTACQTIRSNAIYCAKTGKGEELFRSRRMRATYECISNLSPQQMPASKFSLKRSEEHAKSLAMCKRAPSLNLNLAVFENRTVWYSRRGASFHQERDTCELKRRAKALWKANRSRTHRTVGTAWTDLRLNGRTSKRRTPEHIRTKVN